MEWIGWQVFPCTAATRKCTCGATEWIILSTPDQLVGAAGVFRLAGRRSRPLIRPLVSVAMVTASLSPWFAVTTNAIVSGVLLVMESTRRPRTSAKVLFSRLAGI